MDQQELKTILDLHRKWMMGEMGGIRANFDGAALYGANLDRAYLYRASFEGADLRGANLREANLARANFVRASLDGADLHVACLDPIKADYFAVLEVAKDEVSGLYRALLDGKINGRLYEGDCAGLIGTIAKLKGCHYRDIPGLRPTADRAAERWFTGIRAGDTPDNNPISKITRDWTEEFAAEHGIKFPTRRILWEAT